MSGHPAFARSSPGAAADFYAWLADQMPADRPSRVVEIGTNHGQGAACLGVELMRRSRPCKIDVVVDVLHERITVVGVNLQPIASFVGQIIQGESVVASARYEGGTLDAVFIDGSHAPGCLPRNIDAWCPKVRVGGILAGYDFSTEFPGILTAVTERFERWHWWHVALCGRQRAGRPIWHARVYPAEVRGVLLDPDIPNSPASDIAIDDDRKLCGSFHARYQPMLAQMRHAVGKVSLAINHTPWRPPRVAALTDMLESLSPVPGPLLVNDTDYRGRDWQDAKVDWALTQWRWALSTSADVHVFMTDDLRLAPGFWSILDAMLEAAPGRILGLLSNHPRGPDLALQGWRWYRTRSWVVGPCYVVPRPDLASFVSWFEGLPDGRAAGCKGYYNDDSALNDWIASTGRAALHPLPTPIEHRIDVESAVGHIGDAFSRERVSWLAIRSARHEANGRFAWLEAPAFTDPALMQRPAYWLARGQPEEAPLLGTGP